MHLSGYLRVCGAFLTGRSRPRLATSRALSVRDGGGFGGHQFGKARIFAQCGKLHIFVHIPEIFVSLFHGFLQILQRTVSHAHLGIEFGYGVVVTRTVLWTGQLRLHATARGSFEHLRIKLQSVLIGGRGRLELLLKNDAALASSAMAL